MRGWAENPHCPFCGGPIERFGWAWYKGVRAHGHCLWLAWMGAAFEYVRDGVTIIVPNSAPGISVVRAA